jgi:hypothetical protein
MEAEDEEQEKMKVKRKRKERRERVNDGREEAMEEMKLLRLKLRGYN